jgi:CubicO group peptidase (beta-lactamase class C family)
MLWHNGGTGGFRSFIGFVPGTEVAVVVLSNSARSVDAIGFRILESISDAPQPAARNRRELPNGHVVDAEPSM